MKNLLSLFLMNKNNLNNVTTFIVEKSNAKAVLNDLNNAYNTINPIESINSAYNTLSSGYNKLNKKNLALNAFMLGANAVVFMLFPGQKTYIRGYFEPQDPWETKAYKDTYHSYDDKLAF